MPRTDEEIYAYMQYYNTTTDRKWAFENLCRVEHKTPEEIKEICKKEGERVMKYDQQLKEMIICDRLKGIPASRIAAEQGLTEKQVENIYTVWKQKQKKLETADKSPKDTQTADNPPVVAASKLPPTRYGLWYAVANEFRNFAETTLGAGISVQGIQADEHKQFASLTVKTADGETVVFMATTKN